MPVAVTESRKFTGLRSIRSIGTILLSGAYPTGGEAINFNQFRVGTTKPPTFVTFNSRAGNEYSWDTAAQKLKAFSANGVELAAGAYPAGYTGDIIDYDAEFQRGG